MDNLEDLKQHILNKIKESFTVEELETIRNNYLSKKGELSLMMSRMRDLPAEERPAFGKVVNDIKGIVEISIIERIEDIKAKLLLAKIETEKIDVTVPGDNFTLGTIHPLMETVEDLEDFFIGQGYEIKDGPELESDHYNFEMMNFEVGHPARDMQDTFYIDEEHLLRTHTSPVQARVMQEAKGNPVKIICPGKTYRRDEDDPTHSHQFMQIEGLVIDENVSFANLKDTLLKMVRHLFGKNREIRLRPSYFPFVEPGCEVDVVYTKDDGTKGYIEILGAGMVHPKVLELNGYDASKYSGFAFGIGVERIAILKHNIEDIRSFYTNDLRFLSQFKGDLK